MMQRNTIQVHCKVFKNKDRYNLTFQLYSIDYEDIKVPKWRQDPYFFWRWISNTGSRIKIKKEPKTPSQSRKS